MIKNISWKKYLDEIDNRITIFLFFAISGSILIGIYMVFFTSIGKDITWQSNVQLNFLLLDIIGILNVHFNVGITFVILLGIYSIIYIFCIFKPNFIFKNFRYQKLNKNSDISPFGQSPHFSDNNNNNNYLHIIIQWFSAYFVISVIIDQVQQIFGIHIGTPLQNNPLLSYLNLTAAPLNEEILFRILFLGIPLSIIIFKYKNSIISALIQPSKNLLIKSKRDKYILFIIIITNSIFFGLSHVIFGGNYEIGKITQASIGGLFLGWIYFRYGLMLSITFHWISNYALFSYSLLGSKVFNIPITNDAGNYFIMILSAAFFIIGILFIFRNINKYSRYLIKMK
ncbi:MAG TPA: CPBP family glutamic-type intramembrane protease [Verrucomicrobiae bacterium]|nr:CPBP family glutamic-type intramembrane protease [Verrucomicrobiae bacterium]